MENGKPIFRRFFRKFIFLNLNFNYNLKLDAYFNHMPKLTPSPIPSPHPNLTLILILNCYGEHRCPLVSLFSIIPNTLVPDVFS